MARPTERLFRLVLEPMLEGPRADFEEKHETVSDIDTRAMGGLKALDPNRPIREADIARSLDHLVGAQRKCRRRDPGGELYRCFFVVLVAVWLPKWTSNRRVNQPSSRLGFVMRADCEC